jgi:sortase A
MRRVVASLLILGGLALCGLAARHYVRGWQAQAEGRKILDERMAARAAPPAPATVPAEVPPATVVATPSLELAAAQTTPSRTDKGEGEREVPQTRIPAGYPYGEPIARLKIPVAKIDAVVFGGADPGVLEKGPGHVPGTELPGERTAWHNCVITGHRDSHFRNLGWLRPGHEIELDAPAGNGRYRVVSREIVTPATTRVMRPSTSERLTLITCYPFNWIGPAPKRLVIVAEPVEPVGPVSGHRS